MLLLLDVSIIITFICFYISFCWAQCDAAAGHHSLHTSVSFCRNSKPKNRPSFQQVLLHVEIAAGDVLKTPREIYLNQQVNKTSTAAIAYQQLDQNDKFVQWPF